MSKTNYAIIELATNPFGELKEIAVITVDMATRNITGTFSARVLTTQDKPSELNPKNKPPVDAYELTEVLPIVIKLLNGKKLAAHSGLDVEGEYLNKLFNETYGFDNVITRRNILDTHVLVMRFVKGLNPDIKSVSEHFNVKVGDTTSPLQKAYMTHGNLKNLFDNSVIRQHTYKTASAPVVVPEIKVEPTVIVETVEVEKVVIKEVEKIVEVKVSILDTFKGLFTRKS